MKRPDEDDIKGMWNLFKCLILYGTMITIILIAVLKLILRWNRVKFGKKPTSNGLEKRISIQNGSKKKTYNSIRDMCREEKLDRRTVQRALNGEQKHIKD